MNTQIRAILDSANAPEVAQLNVRASGLGNDTKFSTSHFLVGARRFGEWIGARPARNEWFPLDEILEVLVGFGEQAAIAIADAWKAEIIGTETDLEKAVQCLAVPSAVSRAAQKRGLLGWSVPESRISAGDLQEADKARLTTLIPAELDARVRATAAREGRTLSSFAERAFRQACDAAEEPQSRPAVVEGGL